jgi:hypothetical protein
MSPRARSTPPPPRRRTAPVFRDVRVFYAPPGAKRQQLTEGERQELQRRALEEARQTAADIAARLTRRRPAAEAGPARPDDEFGRGYRRLSGPRAGRRRER